MNIIYAEYNMYRNSMTSTPILVICFVLTAIRLKMVLKLHHALSVH